MPDDAPSHLPRRREKPLLIFDGDCHFCRGWIDRWRQSTGDRVDYAPFQEVGAEFPEIPRAEFEREVKLVEPSGRVTGGARAVFRALSRGGVIGRLLRGLYEKAPGFAPVTEAVYHFVARHRTAASVGTRLLWGESPELPTFFSAREWFLRVLGGVYFIAFVSLWSQVDGLIGQNGILPAREFLDFAQRQLGGTYFSILPTLCQWNASDAFLHALCAGGALLALLLMAGFARTACLALLWLFYLSLSVAGQTFLSFQWDTLLLETGFLSIFLAPLEWRPARAGLAPVSGGGLFLLRWLLFKLMFMSGAVKLTSGDNAWTGLNALRYHYETQPLPTWIGWHAHQAPGWFQWVSLVFLFAAELIAPFFIFGPRRVRMLGFILLTLLQILIALTGNYGFFNLLAAALGLLLLDDRQWPRRLRAAPPPLLADNTRRGRNWPRWALAPTVAVFVVFGALQIQSALRPETIWPIPLLRVYAWIEPFRTLNGYGLFRVMTRTRPEIIVEGSDDGETWRAYEFRWKPGDVNRRPRFVAPHMPRLDWQMWFAALGDYESSPWFARFMERLLRGEPSTLALLERNPFPNKPPRYVRAQLYEYHFTARRAGGAAWWRRELRGEYCPVLSLRAESPP